MKTHSLAQWEEGDMWAGYERVNRILTEEEGVAGYASRRAGTSPGVPATFTASV